MLKQFRKRIVRKIYGRIYKVTQEDIELVNRLLIRARYEFHSPPANFDIVVSPYVRNLKFKLHKGVGHVVIPKRLLDQDALDIILWYFRHILSHIHYCPYDMKTAFQLQKLAFNECFDWNLAYISLYFLSELQIDLIYLPHKYGQPPSYLLYRFRDRPYGIFEVLYAAYKRVFPKHVIHYELDPLAEDFGRQLAIIVSQLKPWGIKIRMIASMLSRLRTLKPKYFKEKTVQQIISEISIPLKEDLMRDTLGSIREIYGEIKDLKTARYFFEHWLRPRISHEVSKEKIEKIMKEISKKLSGSIKSKEKGEAKGEPGVGYEEEPIFPTSYSKPLTKISKERHKEALWRKYWIKARAERIIFDYEIVTRFEKPSWSILAYPDQWLIEDDIETLDIEASLDEGKLRPEVNTVKWVEIPSKMGTVVSSGTVPSAIIVLDSSISMQRGLLNAMTAAFIAYLSAKKAGGKTAVINFSTNFLVGEWNTDDEVKETILAYNLSGYTILPVHEIERLVSLISDKTFIVIISDCGWQNLEEALKRLEILGQKGHSVIIFHIYGWKYTKHLKRVSRSPYLKIIHIDNPERDLEGLVLREALLVYGTHLTSKILKGKF